MVPRKKLETQVGQLQLRTACDIASASTRVGAPTVSAVAKVPGFVAPTALLPAPAAGARRAVGNGGGPRRGSDPATLSGADFDDFKQHAAILDDAPYIECYISAVSGRVQYPTLMRPDNSCLARATWLRSRYRCHALVRRGQGVRARRRDAQLGPRVRRAHAMRQR